MRRITNSYFLMNEMMLSIYKVPQRLFDDEVNKFILRNNELCGDRTATGFMYLGIHYGTYKVGRMNPQLHESLRDEFTHVLDTFQTDVEQLATVKHFFINALNKTMVVSDLEKILPVGLHQYLEAYSVQVSEGSVTPLEPAILDAFVAAKQPAITKIQEVLALNMLIV